MVREKEFEAVVGRFRKIMGPVAETLSRDAAAEAGAKVEGGRVSIKSEEQFQAVIKKLKEKIGKIIGAALAENIIKQA